MFEFALSDTLLVRPFAEADAVPLYAVIEANRGYLAEWLPWAGGQTLAGTAEFIRLARVQLERNDGFQSAILDRDRIIGGIGFHRVDWQHRSASIGYWLAGGEQGRGTMTRAVRALVDFAFASWDLNRVEIRAAVGNARSRAIPERLGFREEGTLRQAELVGDRFLDLVVYSVLASEWRGGTTTAVPSN